MTKHCPSCGNEVDDKELTCPQCGFDFSKDSDDKGKNNKADQKDKKHLFREPSSSFSGAEENENIEWADLKDLSIGHVMDLFNEQQNLSVQEENSADDNSVENSSSESAASEETDSESEKTSSDLSSDNETTEAAAESEEVSIELSDTAALKDYIEAHKREVAVAEKRKAEKADESEKTDTVTENAESEEPSAEIEQEEVEDSAAAVVKDEPEQTKGISEDLEASVTEQTNESAGEDSKSLTEKRVKEPFIPSKSKKPEEIEMDQAPIFFEEKDVLPSELGPKKRPQSQFADLDKAERPKKKKIPETVKRQEPPKQSKKKFPIVLAAAAVLALGAGGWYYSQNQAKGTPTKTAQSSSEETLADQTEESLNNYFLDDGQLYLKADMASVSTESIEENLKKLKDEPEYETLNKLLEKVKAKQTIVKNVNALYTSPAITGDRYKEQPLAADKEVTVEKEAGTDGFSKLVNQAIDNAKAQYDQLQNAKNAVETIYKDGEARAILSEETYAAAVAEVDKIKNEDLKKPLTETLEKAKASLTAAQEQAAAAAVEAANAEAYVQPETTDGTNAAATAGTGSNVNTAVDSSGFSAPDSNGVYTSPVYTVNPADVADTGNPAWVWAAGVQERVIATCIERGYMVAGGYYLEPARIVNGQGYYNLYKTDGTYLVTINAQTGWFKGNASRNAGN